MPSNPAKAFAEAVYFTLLVAISAYIVQEQIFDGEDTSGLSLLVQGATVLVAGALAYVLHAVIFAPLHMKVVWHRKGSHDPLEVSDLPLHLNDSKNRFACHISLEPTSKLAVGWFLLLRKLDYVPVILSESPEEVQISSAKGGSTVYPTAEETSGVQFRWARKARGRSRLRASSEIVFYIEDPASVSSGPTPLAYQLFPSGKVALPKSDRNKIERAFTLLLRRWVRVISDAENIHLDRGAA